MKYSIPLLLVCGSIVAALSAAEGYLQVTHHLVKPLSGFRPIDLSSASQCLELDQLEYRTTHCYNQSGFRGPDLYELNKRDSSKILVLGDSFAEGMGVDEKDRFSNVFENKINSSGDSNKTYTVVNLGQIATNPISYLANLYDIGLSFNPELVVVAIFFGNDFQQAAIQNLPYAWFKPVERLPDYSWQDSRFLGFSHLQSLIRQRADKPRNPLSSTKYLYEYPVSKRFWDHFFAESIERDFYLRKSGLDEATFETALSRLNREFIDASFSGKLNPGTLLQSLELLKGGKQTVPAVAVPYYSVQDIDSIVSIVGQLNTALTERAIPLVVMLIPDIYTVTADVAENTYKDFYGWPEVPGRVMELDGVHQRFKSKLAELNYDVIDLQDSFKGRNGQYYPYDNHWTAAGHQLAADELYRVIKERLRGNR
ncbi:MAG: hypothetical protein FD165_703 [Gammaproteobacteria bacterium]|nr:MAG: hypothetical protein FD165_703 [Gammaproteobacteria bacterium]TND07030.1 MAG: hypothetical protein FD120_198 [Gammaproteobacteria bacterium]